MFSIPMNGDELRTTLAALVVMVIVIVVLGVTSYFVPTPEAASGTMLLVLLVGFVIMGVAIVLALSFVRSRRFR